MTLDPTGDGKTVIRAGAPVDDALDAVVVHPPAGELGAVVSWGLLLCLSVAHCHLLSALRPIVSCGPGSRPAIAL